MKLRNKELETRNKTGNLGIWELVTIILKLSLTGRHG